MKIEHIGLWTADLEKMKEFYCDYFKATAGEFYHNQKTGFQSYFLSFADGARLEIMHREDVNEGTHNKERLGFAHLAVSVGSKDCVDALTELLVKEGYPLLSPCRVTGDGYYESVIGDPEGNRIEITI
jgi:lactoylglutathione lyase